VAPILIIVGTRPEAIKLAPVYRELTSRGADVLLCSTGQHGAILDDALANFGITPDHTLAAMRPGQSIAQLCSRILSQIDSLMQEIRPRYVLVQGDTASATMGAMAAAFSHIPVGHVEAGLRTWDKTAPFPEEINRSAITRFAEHHFCPTAQARNNLLREGISDDVIHVTGNTVIDAVHLMRSLSQGQASEPEWLGHLDPDKRLVLVTAHRRENQGARMLDICSAVRQLAEYPDAQIVFLLHPNPASRDTVLAQLSDVPDVHLDLPLPYPQMLALMDHAHYLLTDSGGLQEEAAALGTPVLVLRESTERPEGVESGVARLVGTHTQTVLSAAVEVLTDEAHHARMTQATNPYGDGRAAERIADVVMSK